MFGTEVAVETEVGLILTIKFRAGAHEVVGSADVRGGVVPQDLTAQFVESAGGDNVGGKLRSRGGGGVEDGLGEHTLPLREGGHYREACDACSESGSLPVCEEESFVLLDRAAQSQAILIAAKPGFRARGGEEVARVQCFVAEEPEEAAVEMVATRLANHHHGTAV